MGGWGCIQLELKTWDKSCGKHVGNVTFQLVSHYSLLIVSLSPQWGHHRVCFFCTLSQHQLISEPRITRFGEVAGFNIWQLSFLYCFILFCFHFQPSNNLQGLKGMNTKMLEWKWQFWLRICTKIITFSFFLFFCCCSNLNLVDAPQCGFPHNSHSTRVRDHQWVY